MQDPTRIDTTLAALRDAWEGQPDFELATLFAMLANQGLGWGAPDEQVTEQLRLMVRRHPPLLPVEEARAQGRWLLSIPQPRQLVTIDAERVIVRRFGARGEAVQPVVWDYRAVRPVGPGRPLVLTDTEGFEHRLGVVERITRQSEQAAPGEVTRRKLGERCFVAQLADALVLLGPRLHVFSQQRRELRTESHAWQRVWMRLGEQLTVQLEHGPRLELGEVRGVYVAEWPTA